MPKVRLFLLNIMPWKAFKVENEFCVFRINESSERFGKYAQIMTDEWPAYRGLENEYASHDVVEHGRGQYVSGNAYTNTAESWIALLKRGIVGTFHHVSEKHLDRYVNEFGFRWNHRKSRKLPPQ